MTTIREHIDMLEALQDIPVDETDRPFGWNKAPPELTLRDQQQVILDALDRLLGIQNGMKRDKVAALREIATTAKRMADGIERQEADRERRDMAS